MKRHPDHETELAIYEAGFKEVVWMIQADAIKNYPAGQRHDQ
jgi:hypothetical protein